MPAEKASSLVGSHDLKASNGLENPTRPRVVKGSTGSAHQMPLVDSVAPYLVVLNIISRKVTLPAIFKRLFYS